MGQKLDASREVKNKYFTQPPISEVRLCPRTAAGRTGLLTYLWVISLAGEGERLLGTLYSIPSPHILSFPPQALEHCGGVDFLVCVAGVNPLVGSTLGASEQVWDKVRTGVGSHTACVVLRPPFFARTHARVPTQTHIVPKVLQTPVTTDPDGWGMGSPGSNHSPGSSTDTTMARVCQAPAASPLLTPLVLATATKL